MTIFTAFSILVKKYLRTSSMMMIAKMINMSRRSTPITIPATPALERGREGGRERQREGEKERERDRGTEDRGREGQREGGRVEKEGTEK